MTEDKYYLGEIYRASHVVDGQFKVYIGKTNQGIPRRWRQHCHGARKSRYTKIRLFQAIRRHGAESFVVEPIALANDEKTLNEFEQMYIAEYKANDPRFGYNMTTGGEGFGWGNQIRKGMKLSDAHKKVLREAGKRKRSAETIEHMRTAQQLRFAAEKGISFEEQRKLSEDRRERKANRKKRRRLIRLRFTTEEKAARRKAHYEKQAAARRGVPRPPEVCKKMRETQLANGPSEKQIVAGRKVGLSNRGRILSDQEKEVKRIRAIEAQQRKTPEQRSASVKKMWLVRKAKYGPTGAKPK